jgi:hypothetical protein|tara:strand:+ start:4715 stop:4855 length:141 start_codon:yes stop_codon:yes gene_type:complete
MSDLTIIAGGKCEKCDHPQQTHEENTGCTYPMEDGSPCACESIGSY